MKFEINAGDRALQVEFLKNNGQLMVQLGDQEIAFEALEVQKGVYSILMDNRSYVVGVCPFTDERINVNGTPIDVQLLDSVHLHLRELGWDTMAETKLGVVQAQIPGLITRIFHSIGDTVEEGEPLFLMEAMKMENEIKAPVSGTINRISVSEGQTVEKGTNIIEIG